MRPILTGVADQRSGRWADLHPAFHHGTQTGIRLAGLGTALTWAIARSVSPLHRWSGDQRLHPAADWDDLQHWQGRHVLAALLACLAFLPPDALILIGLVALDRFRQLVIEWYQARQSGRPAPRFHGLRSWCYLPTLVWIGFSTTISAARCRTRSRQERGLSLTPRRALSGCCNITHAFLEHLPRVSWIAVGMVLYPFLFLVGAWQSIRVAPRCGMGALPLIYFAILPGNP